MMGKHRSRIVEAVRNESAGCSNLRLPTPEACEARTQRLCSLPWVLITQGLRRVESRAGSLA